MTSLAVIAIILAVIVIGLIIWVIIDFKNQSEAGFAPTVLSVLFGMALFVIAAFAIGQPISLRNENIRQDRERDQINYQIALVEADPTKDKIKLNEWILTYNDWVNDVETNKETFGQFAWYRDFDMSDHPIIDLV